METKKKYEVSKSKEDRELGVRTGEVGWCWCWWDDRDWGTTPRHAQDGLQIERVKERPYV